MWCGVVALALCASGAYAAAPTVSLPAPTPVPITDEGSSKPFATAVLTGDNALAISVRFSKDHGTINPVPGLSSAIAGADIVYTLAAQAVGAAQSGLRDLVYTPVADRIPITSSEVTTFQVQATDSVTAAVSAVATVSLTVTPVNDSPNLGFSGALSKIFDNQTSKPFASAVLTDPDAGDVLTATITYPSAHGVLVPGAGSPALTLAGSPGSYSVSGPVASLASFLQKLEFNPTDNRLPVFPPGDTIESTLFSVLVRDLANAIDFGNRSQPVESFNDTPQIAGTLPGSVPDNSAGAAVFSTFSVEDPDVVKVGGSLEPQPVQLTVDFDESAGSSGAGSLVGGNTSFTTTGTAAPLPGDNEVTALLRALRYDPVANRVPVGQTSPVAFRLRAQDSLGAALDSNLSFSVLSINDAPTLQASLNPATVPDNGSIQPFAVTISDPDVGETFRVRIVPLNDPLGVNGVFEPAGFAAQTGTAAGVQEFMEGVVYRPIRNLAGNSNITFRVELTDLHPAPADPAEGTPVQTPQLALTILGKNDPPEIAVPANPVYRTTDDTSVAIRPFPAVGISDPDSPLLTVRLTIEGRTPGTFRATVDGVDLAGATLEFSGTSETVSRVIKAVTFQAAPRPDRVVGEQDTIRLAISVNDHGGETRTDRSTTVVVTAVNAAPVIAGLPALEDQPLRLDPATPGNPLRPFATPAAGSEVTVTDDDNAPLAVTLRLDDPAKGHFENESHPIVGYAASSLGRVVVESTAHGLSTGTIVRISGQGGSPGYNGSHEATVVDADHFEIPLIFVDNAAPAGTWDRGVVAEANRPGVYAFSGLPAEVTAALRELRFVVNPDYLFAPADPGRTRFTLEVKDTVLNQATAELTIVIAEEPVNWLVTSDEDNGDVGTLRWVLDQVAASKSASAHVTFALPEYPAVIRLVQGPLKLERNVTLKGPGADLLAISGDVGGDGLPDVQLLQVHAAVRLEGLTLTHGAAVEGLILTGGAAYVGPSGALSLQSCEVRDSVALQWGGGIDVDGGRLTMMNCLVRGNRTDAALGLGGGGVSLFTDLPCSFENTTFSGNDQGAPTGIGGGALYVENATPASVLDILVNHCTFAENDDAAPVGATGLYANVFGSGVRVRNSIFADGRTRNLEVAGAASIISLGGNASDDRTRTVLTQDGQPKEVFLLDHASDLTNVSGLVTLPLDEARHPLPGYELPRTSPALGQAVAPALPTDQRGFWRDSDPDAGAVERGAGPRLVLNEIGFGPPSALPDFLEFFVPRDAQDVVFDGMTIRVNGAEVFAFPPNTSVATGHGLLVADTTLTPVTCDPPAADCPAPTPVLTLPAGETLGLEKRGVVELVNAAGEVVLRVDYVGQFVDPADPADTAQFDGTSITLSPQLRGDAYLPHGIVGPGPLDGADFASPASPPASPGGTITTPFGSPNGFPFAVADAFIVDEDVAVELRVAQNDLEEDGQDRLILVDVSAGASPLTENDGTSSTALGGLVSILPAGSPLRGVAVRYDPQGSATLKALPVGYEAVDTFHYTVIDIGAGEIESIALADGGSSSTIQATGHRLSNGESVIITGSGTAAYNGTFVATVVDGDHFKIAVPFAGSPAEPGFWETVNPRSPSARSQTEVSVTVLGANDFPVPQPDFVSSTEADEDTPLRLMAGPGLAGIAADFDTDNDFAVRPRISTVTLLGGNPFPGPDTDPDTGETPFLRVVGVVAEVHPIGNFAAASDDGGVTVEAAGHGLTDGLVVLISGYGGFAGYNGFHAISVVDTDHFRIAVPFVDNVAAKGVWAILTDANRLEATTSLGAAVRLEIRVDPLETSVVYDPSVSAELNTLAVGETRRDSFHYAVADSHGAVSLGQVTVEVAGVNDAPVPVPDPVSLAGLGEWGNDPVAISNRIASLDIAYYVPAGSGLNGRADLEVLTADEPPTRVLLADIFRTDEATALDIAGTDLTGNDQDVDATDTLGLASVDATSQAGAALTLLGDGSVRYDPRGVPRLEALAREEPLLDVFSIMVTDQEGGLVPSWVAVLVIGVNDTPEAVDDLATTNEDAPVTIAPLLNDRDLDQNGVAPDNVLRLVPAVLTTPLGARVTITADSFTYDPTTSRNLLGFDLDGLALGQTAQETVVTTTMDGSFLFANDDHYQVTADGSGFVLDLITNDRNLTGVGKPVADYRGTPGQAPVTVVAPGHGLATGMAVHIAGYGGTGLYNRTHLVEVLDADTFTIPAKFEDDAATKGNWSRLRIVEVTSPSRGGSVEIAAGGGTVTYSPAINFVGDEVFAYSLEDDLGNRDGGVVSVRSVVNQLNGNLQANADRFSVARGQSPLLDVLANDNIVPAPGQALALTRIVSQPVLLPGGTEARDLVELAGNQIRFLQSSDGAPAGFPYEVRFAYEISGGGTARAVAEAIVQVVDRGGTLPTRGDAFAVLAGSVDNTLTVLENDRVLPGSAETLSVAGIVSPPSSGTARPNDQGTAILYIPAPGFVGEVTFTYRATDNLGGTGVATVSVAVGGVTTSSDFVAVPFNDSTRTDDDAPVTLDVLANDPILGSAPVNLRLTGVVSADPGATPIGTMSVEAGGLHLVFTPAEDEEGEREFIYSVADQSVPPRLATGRVIVIVARPSVRASSDFFGVAADSSLNPLSVLANDVAIPDRGRALSIVSVGTGLDAPDRGGLVTINEARNGLVYTPARGFVGEETFTYTMTDSRGTDTAKVVVSVGSGRLVASADAFMVFFDAAGGREFTLPVLANDRVLPNDGQTLVITGVGINDANGQNAPSEHGEVRISPDRSTLVYIAHPGAVPAFTERFTYEISDGTARRAQAEVLVRVEDRTAARELETNDDHYTVGEDSAANLLAVLLNDGVKPAGASGWTITHVSVPTDGGLALASGGAILFSPRPGFVGTSTFTYDVSDGIGGTASALVTVKVGDVQLSPDNFAALSGSADNLLDVLANDAIRPTMPVEYHLARVVSPGSRGGVVEVRGGLVLYRPVTPAPTPGVGTFPYVESFEYVVEDDSGGEMVGRAQVEVHELGTDRDKSGVLVTVIGVNDAPTLVVPAPGEWSITDKQSVTPFAGVVIGDVDDQGNELLEVRVVLNDPAAGRLTSLGGFLETSYGSGAWVFNGTGAQATTAIQGLVFVPTENYVPVPETWSFTFDIAVTDPHVTRPVADAVVVQVQAVNDAPTIAGTVADQPVYYRGSIQPFASVLISEVDDRTLQPLAVTISFDATHGTLTEVAGFTLVAPGEYAFQGTAAEATAAIRQIVFAPDTGDRLVGDLTPPPDSEETVFTITVNDGYAAPVVDANASVIAYHSLITKTYAADGSKPDQYGYAVGASRTLVAVGAPQESDGGRDSGAAYVRSRDAGGPWNWGQVARLTAIDRSLDARFGHAVSVSGEIIAVGAPFAKNGSKQTGAVYVFEPGTPGATDWQARAVKILAGDGAAADEFGQAVSLSGDFLAIGAPADDDRGSSSGAVYLFRRTAARTWSQVAKVVPADGAAADRFGYSVSLAGEWLAIGAPSDADNGKDAGSAYLFRRANAGGTAWTQVKKLLPRLPGGATDGAAGDLFGFAVAVSADTVLVGSPKDDDVGNDRGSAFIFSRSQGGAENWGQVVKLAPTQTLNNDQFGFSVALDHDTAVVGMPFDGESNQSRWGSAWAYGRAEGGADAWGLFEKLDPPDNMNNDEFGRSLAISCGTLAVGSRMDDTIALNAGAAYIYDLAFSKAPRVATPLEDQIAVVGELFTLVIPAATFGDADVHDALTLTVTGAGGGVLPGWLSFSPTTGTLSGTPAMADLGTLSLVVTATDRCGDSAAATLVIEVLGTRPPTLPAPGAPLTYEQWIGRLLPARILNNPALEASVWGRLANPDGDAYTNFEEYAFGTRLFAASPDDGPGLAIAVAADGRVAVSYRRRTNDATLRFDLEYSSDLDVWSDAAALPKEEVRTPAGYDSEWVTCLLPADQLPPNLFFRVRISSL